MVFCSHCGKEVAATGTNFCPNCGQSLTGQVTPPPAAAGYNPYKNPTTAALIAIIGGIFGFMGIGHIYAGKIGKGIAILVAGFVLLFTGIFTFTFFIFIAIPLLIIYAVIWFWQIFDARTTARKFNEHVKATGKEPW